MKWQAHHKNHQSLQPWQQKTKIRVPLHLCNHQLPPQVQRWATPLPWLPPPRSSYHQLAWAEYYFLSLALCFSINSSPWPLPAFLHPLFAPFTVVHVIPTFMPNTNPSTLSFLMLQCLFSEPLPSEEANWRRFAIYKYALTISGSYNYFLNLSNP